MIESYCKLSGDNIKLLEFGVGKEFNYVLGSGIYRAELKRQLKDSVQITAEGGDSIDELKITNQSLLTWDDHWIKNGEIIDPGIERLILSRNSLIYFNLNMTRSKIKYIDIQSNSGLEVVNLFEVPNLEYLNLSGCKELKNINLGSNGKIQNLLARDCNMGSSVMEQLLSGFTPTITSNSNNSGAGIFRLQYNTLLDLRGNQINWYNRKIASKIRLLLCNNWVIKWSNDPPTDIVPPQLYSKFVESGIERSRFN